MTVWLLPLLPIVGAFAVLALSRVTRRAAPLTALAVATLMGTSALGVWAAVQMPATDWALWGPRLAPRLSVEGIGRTMVVLVPIVAALVVLYAGAYAREDRGLPRLLALLTAFTGVMELLVIAADFLTLLIAWELAGACSWALIGYEWQDAARTRAARDAFLTTRVGDLGLYIAAAATFAAGGSVRFDALAAIGGPALGIVAGGLLVAAAAKSAQLPFSPWLFSAMAGPTPASALLHSATMVAAGAYLLARLAPVLAAVGWFAPAVVVVGLSTALAGGIVASVHPDLKKALAASTSAQYGFMFVAIGAGVPGAATAHLVSHALFKSLLFLGAGIVMHSAHTLDLASLERVKLGRTLPRVAILVLVGTLALAAVPPLGAAYSKEQVLAAAAHVPRGGPVLAAGVLVAGLLSAFYAARLQLLAFSRGASAPLSSRQRVAAAELASLALLALLSLALGFAWLPGAREIVERVIGGRLVVGAAWELAASLASVAVGVGAAWLLRRRGILATLSLPPAVRAAVAPWFGLAAVARRLVVRPTLALAQALAAADQQVMDAGLRLAVWVARVVSRALARWGERGAGGIVASLVRATEVSARLSRIADEQGLDGAVQGIERGVGRVGALSRRLQTGLAHDYYRMMAIGTLGLVLTAAAAVFGPRLF